MFLQLLENNKDFIGLIIAFLTGAFVLIKWLDTRKRELKEKRYQTYMHLVGITSGKRPDSSISNATEQIAAIWFLLEYKEYYKVTKRVFSNENKFKGMADDFWMEHVYPHTESLLKEIEFEERNNCKLPLFIRGL